MPRGNRSTAGHGDAFGGQQDSRELNFYGIFHITPKGEVEVIAKPKGRPNGLAFSPNGKSADDPHPRLERGRGTKSGRGRRLESAGLIQYDGARTLTEDTQRHPGLRSGSLRLAKAVGYHDLLGKPGLLRRGVCGSAGALRGVFDALLKPRLDAYMWPH